MGGIAVRTPRLLAQTPGDCEMVDHVRLLEVLVRFARTLVHGYSLQDELGQLCADVTELLVVSGAGVMVEDAEGDLRFLAASDDHIAEIERLQVETGEGPCVTAHTTGQAVIIDDLTTVDWLPHAWRTSCSTRWTAGW